MKCYFSFLSVETKNSINPSYFIEFADVIYLIDLPIGFIQFIGISDLEDFIDSINSIKD